MLIVAMAPHVLQAVPKLESPIHSFMACTRIAHGFLVRIIDCIIRCNNTDITPVPTVCHNFFANAQQLLKLVPEDLQIRPASTLKRTSKGDNPTCLDADTKLVAEPRSLEFVRVPALVKRGWFQNLKVSSINGDKTALAVVLVQAVLPFDLQIES